jgi:putative NADPH-quinone reductase
MSFSEQIATSYTKAAQAKHSVKLLKLAELNFDPNLAEGFHQSQALEEDLLLVQSNILWADHVVIVVPIWWGGVPAKLKGLIDRTFLPGFAFKYEKGKSIPTKLLHHKTSRIIMTMDTPPWYYKWFQGAPALKQLDTATLVFSGFKRAKSNMWGPVISADESQLQRWREQAQRLGEFGL